MSSIQISEQARACIAFALEQEGGPTGRAYDGHLTGFGLTEEDMIELNTRYKGTNPDTSAWPNDPRYLSENAAIVGHFLLYYEPTCLRYTLLESGLASKYDELPMPFALPLYDTALLCGRVTAIKMAQRLVLTQADGKIGPITWHLWYTVDSAFTLGFELVKRRVSLQTDLMISDTRKRKFEKGWNNRCLDLVRAIYEQR